MTAEESKQAHTIISYFQKKYKEKYGKNPVVNRNKVQYLIVNMLKDLTVKEIKELIDFYVRTDKEPSLLYFCYEYDTVIDERNKESVDLDERKALMRETQRRVQEYRERYGNAK